MIDSQIILYKFIQINKNLDLESISRKYNLSVNFIKEYQDKVDWYYISAHQKLSENFIREFQNKVNRYCIYKYQKLSKNYQKI